MEEVLYIYTILTSSIRKLQRNKNLLDISSQTTPFDFVSQLGKSIWIKSCLSKKYFK